MADDSVVTIDTSQLDRFFAKLTQAGKGDFKKAMNKWLEDLGEEFLRVLEDEILRRKVIDTRLLLNSFHRGTRDSVWEHSEGNLTLTVGTNVNYAKYVNDGHWTNPKGQSSRFVPGYWQGDRFIYQIGASTGMVLKQKWIDGNPYWDSALKIIERMLPGLLDAKLQEWLDVYFSDF